MTAITERYQEAISGKAEEDPKRKAVVEIRVIILLKYWIQNFPEDFLEPGMDELSNKFDEYCSKHSKEKEPYSTQSALTKSISAKKKKTPISPPPVRNNKSGFEIQIVKYSPKDIANQICLVIGKEFVQISSREYLKETWKYRPDSNIKKLIDRCHFISHLVSHSILLEAKAPARKERYQKWIEIADVIF